MIKNDIVWVKIKYPDESVKITRGTKCVFIIESILGGKPDRDVYSKDGTCVSDNYIFDVETKRFINVEGTEIECSKEEPELERNIDKFARSFI